ncbi:hypothetical protein FHU33_0011 [Blastococcus colisei]|uniref:Uncharacterized protein n=1 Tax=Blastococcus colisei TaxID=1564162 RepID=A0A543P9B4_9ACTN|nr:hypothetical protein [Blastococcus colisei]TQN40666.1 hypothetical protein FHU33_0011 [Blastococcus colisei]
MSSSHPQLPGEPTGSKPPSTQEIPLVQPATGATATAHLPPHPGATPPAPVQPVDTPAPTGPVDFVPGPPGPGTSPPPPPPARSAPAAVPDPAPPATAAAPVPTWPETLESEHATEERRRRIRVGAPRDPATVLGIGLTVLSVVLLALGLTMRWDDLESYWQSIPLWSAFATVCALLGLAAFVAFAVVGRVRSAPAWRVAAAGLVGLAVFWLLVVLPVVATDRGFVLTAALAAFGGALWVGPRQED